MLSLFTYLRFVSNIKSDISSPTSLCPVLLNSILLNSLNIHTPTKTTLITDLDFLPDSLT